MIVFFFFFFFGVLKPSYQCYIVANRYGSWGVCFTYGTWFALRGLAAVGKTYNDTLTIRNGVDFLLKTQRDDGGWGESYLSCANEVTTIVLSLCMLYFFCVPKKKQKKGNNTVNSKDITVFYGVLKNHRVVTPKRVYCKSIKKTRYDLKN